MTPVETEGRRSSLEEWSCWLEKEGIDERSAAPRWHAERRVRPDIGRDARRLGGRGPAVRGLGDVPPEGLAGRPRPNVRVTVDRLARPGHATLRRRRQDLGDGRQRVRI